MNARPAALAACAAALAVTVLAATLWIAGKRSSRPIAPAFTMHDIHGRPHHLSDYRGHVVILNFWASWCAPCRREIPTLIATRRRFSARGLEILGVAEDGPTRAARYANRHGIDYPVLVGMKQAARLHDRYTTSTEAAGAVPYTVIVNRKGRIVQRITGSVDKKRLRASIQPLLDH